MATNFSTYDASSNREDLSNDIKDVSPTSTPFISAIGETEVTNVKHDWQTDALEAASNSNAAIEGADAANANMSPTVRLDNLCQISTKTVQATGSQRFSDAAGKADELDFQTIKKGKELKRDVEKTVLSNKAKAAGNMSTTARECAGIEAYIHTVVNSGSGATEATGDGTDARQAGTLRAFTEGQLKDVLKSAYDNGGEPDLIMVGSFNKQVASTFNGQATLTRNVESSTEKLNTAFNIYGSDFGDLKIVPNRFQNQSSALVIDSELFKMGYFRDYQTHDLAKNGDSDKKQLLVEYTLESCNELGSGAVYDLTVS